MANTAVRQHSRAPAVAPLKRGQGRNFDYKAWLSALLSQKNHQSAFKRALFKDSHPHFMTATKHAAAYAHGLAVQPTIDLTPKEPATLAASALLDAIPRLLSILPGASADKVKLLQGIEVSGEVVD